MMCPSLVHWPQRKIKVKIINNMLTRLMESSVQRGRVMKTDPKADRSLKCLCHTAKSRCPEKKLLVLRPAVPSLASSHTLSPLSRRSTMSPDDKWWPP